MIDTSGPHNTHICQSQTKFYEVRLCLLCCNRCGLFLFPALVVSLLFVTQDFTQTNKKPKNSLGLIVCGALMHFSGITIGMDFALGGGLAPRHRASGSVEPPRYK